MTTTTQTETKTRAPAYARNAPGPMKLPKRLVAEVESACDLVREEGGTVFILIESQGCSPGCALGRRAVDRLGPPTEGEGAEIEEAYQHTGLAAPEGRRPFRAPHFSASPPGLGGGGTGSVRAGEVTHAHRGVLLLGDLAEFSLQSISVMGPALQKGEATLVKALSTSTLPAAPALVIATAQACPCNKPECDCDPQTRARYRARLLKCWQILTGAKANATALEWPRARWVYSPAWNPEGEGNAWFPHEPTQ